MKSCQPKLFDDEAQLLLPRDLIDYHSSFLEEEEGDYYLDTLLHNTPWQQHKVMMYEKEVWTPRLSAWYGNRPIRDGDKRPPIPWTNELQALKQKVEAMTGINFNGVLLNYYRNEQDSVAWHSDKDTMPGMKTEIASISLGAERNFDFRSKNDPKKKYSIKLQHGSLLLMKGDLQRYWEHRIAKSSIPLGPRINLTFRKITTT